MENKVQVDGIVKFHEKSFSYTAFFTKDGVYISLLSSRDLRIKKD